MALAYSERVVGYTRGRLLHAAVRACVPAQASTASAALDGFALPKFTLVSTARKLLMPCVAASAIVPSLTKPISLCTACAVSTHTVAGAIRYGAHPISARGYHCGAQLGIPAYAKQSPLQPAKLALRALGMRNKQTLRLRPQLDVF